MNLTEALKALDEIKPEDVTAELLDQLSEQLRISALAARHELIAVSRAQGFSPDEIEDGLERFERYIEEVTEQVLARLIGRKETRH
jgi:hypothetical protein